MVATGTDRLYGASSSLAVKAPVRAVATTNIGSSPGVPPSGLMTINGVAVTEGDRVLLTAQTSQIDNGIYNASASMWARTGDFDGNYDVVNGTLVVQPLASGMGAFYQANATNPVVPGTTPITFTLLNNPNVTYPLSQAEINAGVTPTNLSYRYGSFLRYGMDPLGVVPSDAGLLAALQCNDEVFDDYPGGGTYLFNTGVTVPHFPVTIRGKTRWPISTGGLNGTKFVLASAAGANAATLLLNAAAYGIAIRNIGFTWQSATVGNQVAIKASNDLRYSTIENCAFVWGGGPVTGNSLLGIQFLTAAVFTGDVVIRDNFFDVLYAGISLQGACTTVKIYGNEFYGHAGLNAVNVLGAITPGSLYTNGSYVNVALTGGTGAGALANIVVAGGAVTSVTLVTGGSNYTNGDTLSAAPASIGAGGSGFSIALTTVGNQYGLGVQCIYPVTEPVLSMNYFEGFNTAIYSNGAAYLKQIGNDYGPNTNQFTWVRTSFARIWNQSFGETFAGAGAINYPQDNSGLCQVLSGPGTYYLDNAVVNAGGGFQERLRSFNLGDKTDVTFSAGNFTANGAMTWTVSGGQAVTYAWSIAGHTLTVWWDIAGSTVAGTPNTLLQIAIPNGYTAAKAVANPCLVTDNGTNAIGLASVGAGGAVIQIQKAAVAANWTASASTGTEGMIQIPVN